MGDLDGWEESKAAGREMLLTLLAQDYASEHGLTLAEAHAAIVRALEPRETVTVEDLIREMVLEALTNLAVYGQHPPPPDPPDLQGIRNVGWLDEVVGFDPLDVHRAVARLDEPVDLDAIVHDPFWSLDRSRA